MFRELRVRPILYVTALCLALAGATLLLGQSGPAFTERPSGPALPPESSVLYFAARGQPLSAPPPPPEGIFFEPPLTETTTVFTVNAVNDSNVDVEPFVIAVRPVSQDRTTSVYIKYVDNPQLGPSPLLFYTSTTDFVNFTRSSIPGVVGYYWIGDPWLDANIAGTGIAPNRVYLAGLAFNPIVSAVCGSPYLNPSAIPVWRSNDGGNSWLAAKLVETNTNTTIQLDKPALAVSYAQNSAGRVYVVWARRNYSTCSTEIRFAQSTNGGETYSTPTTLASGSVGQAQVVVSALTGYIYVLWVDYSGDPLNAIRLRRSTTLGASWDPIDTGGPTGYLTGGANDPHHGNINGPTGTQGLRAISTLFARFNYVTNKVCVVWHEYKSSTSALTSVYYSAKSSAGWQPKVKLNDNTNNTDQFMGAFDFDPQGRMTVTWYDRRSDPSNLRYELWASYISSNGQPYPPGAPNTRISTIQSNPGTTLFDPRFIGDYQGSWFWPFSSGSKWIAAWVGVPTATNVDDIYFSGITQP